MENELLLALDEGKELEIEAKTVNKLLTLNKSLEFAQERYCNSTIIYIYIYISMLISFV